MPYTINENQPKSAKKYSTLAQGFKFVGVLGTKEIPRTNNNNDSGIQKGSGGGGNTTGHDGHASGNDGVGTPVHD